MLVLTRKLNEAIVIGENVKITILEIKDQSVKIGIEAPREISVHRDEVFAEISLENKRARQGSGTSPQLDQAANLLKQKKKPPRSPRPPHS